MIGWSSCRKDATYAIEMERGLTWNKEPANSGRETWKAGLAELLDVRILLPNAHIKSVVCATTLSLVMVLRSCTS